MTEMKQLVHIVFFLVNAFAFAQPPVNQNSVTNTNSEVLREEKAESETSTQQQKTLNDFVVLYNKANSSPTQKNPTTEQQNSMNEFIKDHFSNSEFEYNLSTFMASGFDVSKKKYLDKAKAIQPKNQEVLIQSVALSFLLVDTKTLKADLIELRNQNFITDDDLSYARDVLLSVPKYSTLITHGITDTYPILYLQEVENFLKDEVELIPMMFFQSDEFYYTLKNMALLHMPKSRVVNPDFLKEFCKYNNSYYLSLTIPTSYFEVMKNNLYPIGLTFGYTPSEYQNSTMNRNLWEYNLKKTVISNAKDKNGRQLSANYLPMLINLYKYYESENDSKQLNTIKATIRQIGVNIGKTNLLNELGLN